MSFYSNTNKPLTTQLNAKKILESMGGVKDTYVNQTLQPLTVIIVYDRLQRIYI